VKVTQEKTENSQAFLTIEMGQAEMEASLEDSYRRLVKTTRVPGFRKGKAPRAILERHIGREGLLQEALNDLVPEAYEKAVKEKEIEPVARPEIEITQTEPLVFKAVVPLRPTVTLGDYRKIRIKPEPVKVSKDDVAAVIDQLRHQQAIWEPVERPVEYNDLVVMDMDSDVEGEVFINREGIQLQVLSEQPFPAPGFPEQITGMKKDEEKEFSLQFPSDHPRGDLAGKEARFKVKVTEVKQEKLPEIDDEFAKEVDQEFENLDTLKERISSNLKTNAEEKTKQEHEEKVIDAVADASGVEFPPVLVEAEIDRVLSQRFQGGRQQLEQYLNGVGKTEEEIRQEVHPFATKRVTSSLVLNKVTEEENIEASETEIDEEIQRIKEGATENRDEVDRFLGSIQARDSIRQNLTVRKTIDELVKIARGSRKSKKTKQEE
jgi:trigger factor